MPESGKKGRDLRRRRSLAGLDGRDYAPPQRVSALLKTVQDKLVQRQFGHVVHLIGVTPVA